jgi:hypothetical protein
MIISVALHQSLLLHFFCKDISILRTGVGMEAPIASSIVSQI